MTEYPDNRSSQCHESEPNREFDSAEVSKIATCGLQSAALAEAQALNQLIPQYKILDVLGHGGQGVVYRAIQQQTGRLVALKVMHYDASISERRCRRFEREVEVIARLHHQHVITVFDSGTVAGRPYLSMELVEGLPIDDYTLLHRLAVENVILLIEKVCRAVASVHQRGVIHRDLKPSNILVDIDGEPRILDFGLAKCFDDGLGMTSLSVEGQVVGTLAFLSPEQARAEMDEVDSRSDVYSLGVILYLLFTGVMPYDVSGSPEQAKRTILEDIPNRPDLIVQCKPNPRIHGAIPVDLSHVILKALAKEKDRRYQSADALADDLRRCLTHEIVQARADSRWYVFRRAARRYRTHLVVAAAFVLMIMVGLVSSLVLWSRAEHAARLAQAGMQMGSYVRLGSIRRDEGRIDQAIELCRMAIELGEQIKEPDLVVYRQLYSAHHILAQEFLRRPADNELCRHHAVAANRIASDLIRTNPQEPEHRRLLAFSKRLNGRIAYNAGDLALARAELEESAALFATLLDAQMEWEDSTPIEFEVAHSQQVLARVLLKAGRRDEGMQRLHEVQQKLILVCTAYPDSLDFLLELVRTEDMIAENLLRSKSPTEDALAAEILNQVESRLQAAFDRKLADRRLHDVQALVDSAKQHRQLATKRIASRQTLALPGHMGRSPPSGVSTGSSSPSIGPSSTEAKKE